jgi:hypothetical protein
MLQQAHSGVKPVVQAVFWSAFFLLITCLWAGDLQAQSADLKPPVQLAVLPAGTNIQIVLAPGAPVEGQVVRFIVRADVRVNGQVLVAAGAGGQGRLIGVEQTGKGAVVEFLPEILEVVDGRGVMLRPVRVKMGVWGEVGVVAVWGKMRVRVEGSAGIVKNLAKL